MTDPHTPTPEGWTMPLVNHEHSPLFYRETDAGKQYVYRNELGLYEFMQQGYTGVLYFSELLDNVLTFANQKADWTNLRVDGLSIIEISQETYNSTYFAMLGLSTTGSRATIENARKYVGVAESHLISIRQRLLQKDPLESGASKAERFSADFRRAVYAYFYSVEYNVLDAAVNEAELMRGMIDALYEEVQAKRAEIEPKGYLA